MEGKGERSLNNTLKLSEQHACPSVTDVAHRRDITIAGQESMFVSVSFVFPRLIRINKFLDLLNESLP